MFEELPIRYSSINAFYVERIDPLFGLALQYVEPGRLQTVYVEAQLFLFAIGMFLLLRTLKVENLVAGLLSTFTLMSVVYVVGIDPFLFKAFYFPLLLFSAVLLLRQASLVHGLLFALFGILWVSSATSLAVLGLLLVFIVERFLPKGDFASDKGRQYLVGLTIFFIALAVVLMPEQSIASYPPRVQLGADTVYATLPAPFWGDYDSINSASFADLRMLNEGACARLLVVSVLFFAISLVAGLQSLLSVAVCLGLSFLAFFPEALVGISQLGDTPFHALRRIIPGMWSVDLVAPAITFSLVILGLLVSRCNSKVTLAFSFIVVFLLSLLEQKGGFLPEVLTSRVSKEDHFVERGADRKSRIEHSPSAFVLEHFGDWILQEGLAEERTFAKLERLFVHKDFEMKVSTNVNQLALKAAVDGKDHTRWATGRPQKAGDFFQVDLDRELEITRIVLSAHKFPSDFPNSLKLEVLTSSGWELIQKYDDWYGPLAWTKDGYPFFDARSMVFLDLPRTTKLKGMRFTLLKGSAKFDWSVAEVKLYR